MVQVKSKRPAASRASKHTKKYWRKGTDISAIEDSIHERAEEERTGGVISDRADDDLFVVDKTPTAEKPAKKFTKKQQAALDKITRNLDKLEDVELPKASTKVRTKAYKRAIERETVAVPKKKSAKEYDLWDTDFVPKLALEHEDAAEHILQYTKKKGPKLPSTITHLPTLLKPVPIPKAGASYNPDAENYQEYVSEIAQDEMKLIHKEKKIKEGTTPKYEKMVTHDERRLELTEGLTIDPRYKTREQENEEGEVVPVEEEMEESVVVAPISRENRITKKERNARKKELKEERIRKQKKAMKLSENEIFKVKAIVKKLNKDDASSQTAAAERKKNKLIKKLTTRQKLGRGEFEDEEAPFLLEEELTGNLRQLKPQGNMLTDRIKSMQKRNMLPIGRDKKLNHKLKTKLKKKMVERRSVREIKKGTKLI